MRKRVALMSLLMCTATLEYSQTRSPVRIIGLRLAEGFRVLIASGPALDIGRKAAGR